MWIRGWFSLNAHLSIAFGCLRFTPALNSNPDKLPPLVAARGSRDQAGFEIWGSDIFGFALRRVGRRSEELSKVSRNGRARARLSVLCRASI
jgi:hypothetical protein